MYVHIRDQNDNATYASTRWVPTVRNFLACKDVAGGSQQSGGESFFARNMDALPCMRRCSWWVPTIRGKRFFTKYGGPSGGSLLSGGGIIIFRVIRRHFLACEDIVGGSDLSAEGTFFFSRNTEALSAGPRCQGEESLFCA